MDPETLTLARLVDDIEGLRQALGLDEVFLLGHSFGGFLALMYALTYPRSLAGLILVGTAASIRVQDASAHTVRAQAPQALIRAREHLWNGTLDGAIKTDGELREAFERALPIYYHQRHLAPETLPAMIFRLEPRRVLTLREVPRYHVEGRVADITAPTLVTVGRHDLITPMAASERLAATIPGAMLAVFEESGHMPFAEESAGFSETVCGFLRGLE